MFETPSTQSAEPKESPEKKTPISDMVMMLTRADQADMELESKIADRFGESFSDDAQSKLKAWTESLLSKGESAIDWIEVKGLPLPKSKLGMRMLGGAMGITGSVVPGLGILLPVAYILWKRSNDVPSLNIEKQYAT
jgi:hypothetical protein